MRKSIEQIFSNDLKSPSFPILASYYYQDKNFNKAIQICEIGLDNDPNNHVGKYIYAKSLIMAGKVIQAELILKKITMYEASHLSSILLLIEVMIYLERSANSIIKHINKGRLHFSHHSKIKELIQVYNIEIPFKASHRKVTTGAKQIEKIRDTSQFDLKLATKTMYRLLREQKKYNDALKILDIMLDNHQNSDFATKEKTYIVKKLNKETSNLADKNR